MARCQCDLRDCLHVLQQCGPSPACQPDVRRDRGLLLWQDTLTFPAIFLHQFMDQNFTRSLAIANTHQHVTIVS